MCYNSLVMSPMGADIFARRDTERDGKGNIPDDDADKPIWQLALETLVPIAFVLISILFGTYVLACLK